MPRWARIAHAGVMIQLIALVALTSYNLAHQAAEDRVIHSWFPILCLLTLLGVWRRVAWGRFLYSVVSLFLALVCLARLMPDLDDHLRDVSRFEPWLGSAHGLVAWWLLIVAAVIAVLAPAVAIGWRKHWFRSRAW